MKKENELFNNSEFSTNITYICLNFEEKNKWKRKKMRRKVT